ncbi:MAG TPA: MMPL family transporter, partial [Treponemataceae bacterium]|nr:MMPL family transporter [Treponemataceae bacterium]
FGLTDSMIMGVHTPFNTVLETETLHLIADITAKIEQHPLVDSVRSLTNMDYIESENDSLLVSSVLPDFSPKGIETFMSRIMEWEEVYWGTFISKDLHLASIIIQPLPNNTDQENGEIYSFLRKIEQQHSTPALQFPIAGMPVVKEEINRSLMTDIVWLIPTAALIIMIILLFSFKCWEGVVFPLASLVTAGIWVMGLIGYLNITFTMATLLVPVLLLVVGSAYAIHVLSHFYEALSRQREWVSPEKIADILKKSIKKIKIPVLLAGATTAGGFIALVFSPLGPFKAFGLLSAAGVVASQITSLIFLPLLIKIRYRKGYAVKTPRVAKHTTLEKKSVFSYFEKIVTKGKVPAIVITFLLFALTLFFLPRIEPGSDMLEFFVPKSRVVQDTELFNNTLGGSNTINLMIQAPQKGEILTPEFLKNMDNFSSYIKETNSSVSQVQSVLPSLKRINQLMNSDRIPYEKDAVIEESGSFFDTGFFTFDEEVLVEETKTIAAEKTIEREENQEKGGTAFYEIPTNPAKYGLDSQEDLTTLLTQYLVFYSGNLSMVINDSLEPNKTLITIQVNDMSYAAQRKLKKSIEYFWDHHLHPNWEYELGGGASLTYVLSHLVTRSQYLSLIGAIVIVLIMISIMFRSFIAGLFGMIPVVFSLVSIFLTMSLSGFKLDIITSLLASLAIGIGVDYAIHFIDAYTFHLKNSTGSVLSNVYRTTGKAILINALSVAFGFLSLTISQFIPITQMGILFSVAMLSACLASLLILPMALEVFKPAFIQKTTMSKTISTTNKSLSKGVFL